MKKVLIAGLGYVGQTLARTLRDFSFEVSGIKRRPIDYKKVNVYAIDLTKKSEIAKLPQDFELLFYLVAAEDSSAEAYEKAYLESNKNLFEHLQNSPLQRSIFVSSTSVYHQNDGSQVDESTTVKPEGYRGRIMLEAEQLFQQQYANSSIVRAAGIYGPGRTRLLENIYYGTTKLAPKITNRIHRDDLAAILHWLIDQSAQTTALINAVDDLPVDKHTLIQNLSGRLGVAHSFGSAEDQTPGKYISNERLKSLGFTLKYKTYLDGYKEIIEEFLKGKRGPG